MLTDVTLPIVVKLRVSQGTLVFCADVPVWRWPTEWDRPFGELHFTLQEAAQEMLP